VSEYEGQTDHISLLHQAIQRMDDRQDSTNKVLFEKFDKMDTKVDKLSEIVGQQAVLFEKFSTMEANHKDSMNRVWKIMERNLDDSATRDEKIEKRVEKLENYTNVDGCPAHLSFLKTRNKEINSWASKFSGIEDRQFSVEKRIKEIEDTPMKIIERIGIGVLGTIGAGVGAWLLYHFGFGGEK